MHIIFPRHSKRGVHHHRNKINSQLTIRIYGPVAICSHCRLIALGNSGVLAHKLHYPWWSYSILGGWREPSTTCHPRRNGFRLRMHYQPSLARGVGADRQPLTALFNDGFVHWNVFVNSRKKSHVFIYHEEALRKTVQHRMQSPACS